MDVETNANGGQGGSKTIPTLEDKRLQAWNAVYGSLRPSLKQPFGDRSDSQHHAPAWLSDGWLPLSCARMCVFDNGTLADDEDRTVIVGKALVRDKPAPGVAFYIPGIVYVDLKQPAFVKIKGTSPIEFSCFARFKETATYKPALFRVVSI